MALHRPEVRAVILGILAPSKLLAEHQCIGIRALVARSSQFSQKTQNLDFYLKTHNFIKWAQTNCEPNLTAG